MAEIEIDPIIEDFETVDENSVPQYILDSAKEITLGALPEKSKDLYIRAYNNFMKWKVEQKIGKQVFSEDVMIVYFSELTKNFAPSTMWSRYSMLRTTITHYDNVNIGYPKLISLLKQNAVGFRQKKAKVFEGDELYTFLNGMDDYQYLAAKVITIFGIYGATRTAELVQLKTTDVLAKDDVFLVKLERTKTNIDRSFTIEGTFYVNIVRKYCDLRPKETPHDRFFINFQMGKCTTQPIGKHKFGGTPKMIASLLKLEGAEEYTGHSFRRTGITLAVEAGADFLELKRHIGWRSLAIAEGYVNDSKRNKRKMARLITSAITKSNATATMTSTNPTTSMATPSNATISTAALSNQTRSMATSSNTITSMGRSSNSNTSTAESSNAPSSMATPSNTTISNATSSNPTTSMDIPCNVTTSMATSSNSTSRRILYNADTELLSGTVIVSSQVESTSIVSSHADEIDTEMIPVVLDQSKQMRLVEAKDFAARAMKTIQMEHCSNFTVNFNIGQNQ